jgi:anti-sigma regulatory factor (Ser/Thr protein kinase)
MFGQQRLEAHLAQNRNANLLFEAICSDLTAFRTGEQQCDDITLIEITCDAALAAGGGKNVASPRVTPTPVHWQMTLELGADTLQTIDPLPHVMQTLMEIQGLHEHRGRLYTILAELFTNALDHGLLRLDSTLKHTPQGFGEYYAARDKRLAALRQGRITIAVAHTPRHTGGQLTLRIEDSGPGFDYHRLLPDLTHNTTHSGRGIPLVRALCQALVYHGRGNCVEAVYVWA